LAQSEAGTDRHVLVADAFANENGTDQRRSELFELLWFEVTLKYLLQSIETGLGGRSGTGRSHRITS